MSSKEVPSGRSRVRYTAEFKADAVAMVIDAERSIVDVARGQGLGQQTWATGSGRPASTAASEPA